MKKSELVTLVAEKTGFSKKDTEKTIDTVFTAIADIMAAGDKLDLHQGQFFFPFLLLMHQGFPYFVGKLCPLTVFHRLIHNS